MADNDSKNYDLKSGSSGTVPAPELNYGPPAPESYRPRIGLIACGGITKHHLGAYQRRGWDVAALCDLDRERAEARRREFAPEADVTTSHHELLARDDIDVVDIAAHPVHRPPLIEAALKAGKHVLSQKPFVLDLGVGEKLVALADAQGRKLAVNQNGRWAPYVRYAVEAIRAGHLGEVHSVNIAINWDHTWCKGTPFEEVHHLILYDFGIHWFDQTHLYFGEQPAETVYATAVRAPGQEMKPPMVAGATIRYPNGTASLQFDGHSRFGSQERLVICGTEGTYRASGITCGCDDITLFREEGASRVTLDGGWFQQGFEGSMGELLCAIEEDREPENSARANLHSLAVCFAALQSADTGQPVKPGDARVIQ